MAIAKIPMVINVVNTLHIIIKMQIKDVLTQSIFMDAKQDSTLTPNHFDDYLSHPSITTVLLNANLAARTPH